MIGSRMLRATLVAAFSVIAVGCAPSGPLPSSPPPESTAPSPGALSVSRTPTMDELIALYEAEGPDCEAVEYSVNSFFQGMAVFCEGPVGEAQLLVEGRYGEDDELDIAVFQVIPEDYTDPDGRVSERDAERAIQIVTLIPHPGRAADGAESDLLTAMNDPGCLGDNCTFDFNGGHWSFRRWPHGGWMARLSLDRPDR